MSTSTSTEQPTQDEKPAAPEQPTTPKPQPPAQEAETDWKAEARKWEQRAKDNKSAAERLAELEQAQMSESEKAAARVRAAEERAAELEVANSRKDLAIEHRLSSEDAELLEGMTDVDAMRRVAERLARQAEEEAGPRAPKPHPAQREGDSPAEDKDALARAFFGI